MEVESVGRRYVQCSNHTYRRSGTLWEGRFRSTVIDAEAYLLTCTRDIELNPVCAQGMVEHPADYPWPSYHGNALGTQDALLTRHELYQRLGRSTEQRQSSYRQLFRAQLAKADIEAMREATNKARALGNNRFRAKIEALAGRRATPLPKGRPAKSPENGV